MDVHWLIICIGGNTPFSFSLKIRIRNDADSYGPTWLNGVITHNTVMIQSKCSFS